ncbi:hypothetical protein Pcinc_011307 [Petrolisthes cinctipes]|uniref:Uncharacterized protein n=1 Tax=Petrolisthes cinctipes TaxID=88211 RepID=A0AAE1G736_PETCI|nr:hypothetical protein Pcinc_011307 [Petrolisthes cinctipes]
MCSTCQRTSHPSIPFISPQHNASSLPSNSFPLPSTPLPSPCTTSSPLPTTTSSLQPSTPTDNINKSTVTGVCGVG